MNELALFTGCGGGLLGTALLGIRPVAGVEKEPYARKIIMLRQSEGFLPVFPTWDDIKTFDPGPWAGKIDIITGGFPCQAFSRAAHGRNVAPDLWPDMYEVIERVRPPFVFAENVVPAPIERAGRDLARLGYQARGIALSAKDLGGDHIRRRYWLLAYADNPRKLLYSIYGSKEQSGCNLSSGVWSANPGIGGMANGVATKVDRLRCTGNGQVPIVAATALATLAMRGAKDFEE